MRIPDSKQRIGVINALRAFAALAVAWGHFVAGQGKYLGLSGKFGYLGVDIFFVISGFVIPWSLYRSRYVLRDYPRFLLKRNVRLYPPYLASIAITILATNFVLVPLFHIPAHHRDGARSTAPLRVPERLGARALDQRCLLDAGH